MALSKDKKYEPAFLDEELRKRSYKSILSWHGTPYGHLVCVKGRGADCTMIVGALCIEAGILKKMEYDYYPREWHMNTTREWVIESLYRHLTGNVRKGYAVEWRRERVPQEEFRYGDLLTFKTTKMNVSNHCGIWVDQGMNFFNSILSRGCCFLTYGSFWDKRLTGMLRVYKEI